MMPGDASCRRSSRARRAVRAEAAANRSDNSFELRRVTADRFAELGLHPPDIRVPLAELLAGRTGPA